MRTANILPKGLVKSSPLQTTHEPSGCSSIWMYQMLLKRKRGNIVLGR